MSGGVGQIVGTFLARVKADEEEHERRLHEDPEYRDHFERREAERAAREAKEQRAQAERKRTAIKNARGEKGIPEAFWPYLDAWRAGQGGTAPATVAEAHGWVERFLRRESPAWVFLFLAGSVGVGKTAAACRFLDAPRVLPADPPFQPKPVEAEVPGLFVTGEDLAKAGAYDGKFWDPVRNAARLVVDDLGWESLDSKGWSLGNIVALLSHRHAHQLPTVVTTNLTMKRFLERFGAGDGGRLENRLIESAWFVPLAGPSLRKPLSIPSMTPNGPSAAASEAAAREPDKEIP